jgi:parallel beta-helix repeat protein
MWSANAYCFERYERASRISGLQCGNKRTSMVASKVTSRFVAQTHRLRLLLVAATSISPTLQLQIVYAQNGSEQLTLDTKTHAVQNSISDATPRPIQDKNGQIVNVKTFGAVGDGVTNDTEAFGAALKSLADAGGGTCLVPKGTYLISASGITRVHIAAVSSDVHLVGEGRRESVLKVNGMPTNHLLRCDGDKWSVENLTFDMGDYTPPKIGFAAIVCRGNNWRVANCAIVKSGKWGIQAYGGSNWSIEGNYINRTVPGAMPPTGAILVTAQNGVWPIRGRVSDNVCEGVGISFSGTDGIIARNRVNRSGSGSGIFVQGSPSTRSPKIIGNICTGGSSGYDGAVGGKWASVTGFEIWAPESVICNNVAHDNDAGGIAVGGQNSIVIANTVYNNGRAHAGFGGFAARVNPTRGASASHSIFIGNVAYDSRYPSHNATQDYGYLEQNATKDYGYVGQAAELTDIKHFGNDYNRNRVGPTKSRAPRGPAVAAQISPEMKRKLNTLAEDVDLPEKARRAVREYLSQ